MMALFQQLDRHRLIDDPQHARFLTRRGADAAGELGKVVGLVQRLAIAS